MLLALSPLFADLGVETCTCTGDKLSMKLEVLLASAICCHCLKSPIIASAQEKTCTWSSELWCGHLCSCFALSMCFSHPHPKDPWWVQHELFSHSTYEGNCDAVDISCYCLPWPKLLRSGRDAGLWTISSANQPVAPFPHSKCFSPTIPSQKFSCLLAPLTCWMELEMHWRTQEDYLWLVFQMSTYLLDPQ